MDTNCIISIFGKQFDGEGEPARMELVTAGDYSDSEEGAEFSYEETELTGLEGTRTTFRVMPDYITMTREGKVNSEMIFEAGKKHFFAYDTPFGAFTMGINTHQLHSRLNENGGDVDIRYAIDMESNIVSKNEFHINIRKA